MRRKIGYLLTIGLLALVLAGLADATVAVWAAGHAAPALVGMAVLAGCAGWLLYHQAGTLRRWLRGRAPADDSGGRG
jgi:hypothetical protein